MRKYLLAAASALAFASPATALDNSFYVGVEGGAMIVEDTEFDYSTATTVLDSAMIVDHKTGVDLDLIGGYDFGWLRAEAELGYKRAGNNKTNVNQGLTGALPGGFYDTDGRVSVLSAMANLLIDFGDEEGWAGYIGGGAGLARVKYKVDINGLASPLGFSDSDDSFAWQAIAGVRKAISSNIDVGLKYRFFNASNLNYDGTRVVGTAAPVAFNVESRYRSHSLLASLIFNFAAPPPPPPPPPPRPLSSGNWAASISRWMMMVGLTRISSTCSSLAIERLVNSRLMNGILERIGTPCSSSISPAMVWPPSSSVPPSGTLTVVRTSVI